MHFLAEWCQRPLNQAVILFCLVYVFLIVFLSGVLGFVLFSVVSYVQFLGVLHRSKDWL